VIVEIERGDGLDTGMFRVTAEVYTGGDVAPQGAPPPYDPGPPMGQGYDQPQGYGQPQGYQQQQPAYGQQPGRGVRLIANDGRTYPLSIGSTVIGRGDQANLRLPDVGISRRHARLDYDGAGRATRPSELDCRFHGNRSSDLRRRVARPGAVVVETRVPA